MSISYTELHNRIPGQAKASVRLATLSDEALLWELGMLHAARTTEVNTDSDEARIVELEAEYVRRHPITDVEPAMH